MNLLMTMLAIVIIAVSLVLSVNHPYEFLIVWGLTASGYDANGVAKTFDSYFGVYSLLMHSILVLSLFISIWRYRKQEEQKYVNYYRVGIALIVWMVFCFLVNSITEGVAIFNIFYVISDYSPIIMLIWMMNHQYYMSKGKKPFNYILFYVTTQVIFAFMIVYLPEVGIHVLDRFSGANFIADGYVYNQNLFYLQDIMTALTSKYNFNGLGQFHNGNDMGFYGGAGIIISACFFSRKGILMKMSGIVLACLSVLLWGNSGMRGPIVGIAIGVIVFVLFSKTRSKYAMILGIVPIIVLILYSEIGSDILSYFIPEIGDISYVSRNLLRMNGLAYIRENPVVGAGGLLGFLTAKGIDPHELPLRMTCLFGIPGGLLMGYLLYVRPIIDFLKSHSRTAFVAVAYAVIVLVSLTDNYTDICLFWLLFSESMCIMNGQKNSENGRIQGFQSSGL